MFHALYRSDNEFNLQGALCCTCGDTLMPSDTLTYAYMTYDAAAGCGRYKCTLTHSTTASFNTNKIWPSVTTTPCQLSWYRSYQVLHAIQLCESLHSHLSFCRFLLTSPTIPSSPPSIPFFQFLFFKQIPTKNKLSCNTPEHHNRC